MRRLLVALAIVISLVAIDESAAAQAGAIWYVCADGVSMCYDPGYHFWWDASTHRFKIGAASMVVDAANSGQANAAIIRNGALGLTDDYSGVMDAMLTALGTGFALYMPHVGTDPVMVGIANPPYNSHFEFYQGVVVKGDWSMASSGVFPQQPHFRMWNPNSRNFSEFMISSGADATGNPLDIGEINGYGTAGLDAKVELEIHPGVEFHAFKYDTGASLEFDPVQSVIRMGGMLTVPGNVVPDVEIQSNGHVRFTAPTSEITKDGALNGAGVFDVLTRLCAASPGVCP